MFPVLFLVLVLLDIIRIYYKYNCLKKYTTLHHISYSLFT